MIGAVPTADDAGAATPCPFPCHQELFAGVGLGGGRGSLKRALGHVAMHRRSERLLQAQILRSMSPPQLRQTILAVSDMRTIVECAPQLGQSDRSS